MNQNLSEAAMNWEAMQINIQLPILQAHPDEEVDHEEDVEGKVNLLGRVFHPWSASFHAVSGTKVIKQKSKSNNLFRPQDACINNIPGRKSNHAKCKSTSS